MSSVGMTRPIFSYGAFTPHDLERLCTWLRPRLMADGADLVAADDVFDTVVELRDVLNEVVASRQQPPDDRHPAAKAQAPRRSAS